MSPPRLLPFLALLALSACSADAERRPALPSEPAVADVTPPASPPEPCDVLAGPLHTLRTLATMVSLGRSMPLEPLRPELFVAELDRDAGRARSVVTGDAALAGLASGVADRLAKIATAARALERRGGAPEAARALLLDEMERGEILVAGGDERCGKAENAAGRLPASALQRVLRGAEAGFTKCYEAGLRRNPSLQGTVRVRFVVARDGSVSQASDADRSPIDPLEWAAGRSAAPMPDPEVSTCVVGVFRRLGFPRPEGGTFSGTHAVDLRTKQPQGRKTNRNEPRRSAWTAAPRSSRGAWASMARPDPSSAPS